MTKEEKIIIAVSNGLSLEEAEKSWFANTEHSEIIMSAVVKKLELSLTK